MTENQTKDPSPQESIPRRPPREADAVFNAVAMLFIMIPIGGLALMWAINAFLYAWLDVVPKISYGEACGGMTLAWMIRYFMYPRR